MPNDRPTRSQPATAHGCGVGALGFTPQSIAAESMQRRSDRVRCGLLLALLILVALGCARRA